MGWAPYGLWKRTWLGTVETARFAAGYVVVDHRTQRAGCL